MATSSRALVFGAGICKFIRLGLGGTRLLTSDDRQVNLVRSPGLHAQTPGSRRRARRRQQDGDLAASVRSGKARSGARRRGEVCGMPPDG
jgi:hypothetical protein